MKDEEEKYRLFFENAPLSYQSLDKDGCLLEVNRAWIKLFGYSKEEVIGKWFGDFLTPESQEFFKINVSILINTGAISDIEYEIIKKNGTHAFISATGKSSYIENGNFVRTHCIFNDITDKRKAEGKAQLYLDIAGVILMVINKKGEIIMINKKGYEVLEYEVGELIGKNWFNTCLPKALKNEVYNVFKKLIRGEIQGTEFYENSVLTKSGKEKIIAWHNTNLYDDDGNIIGTLSSGEDITEKKEVKKIKKEFLSRASHELKTPLISIIGYAELFLYKYGSKLDEEAKNYINQIKRGYQRLRDLSDKLIKAEKLDAKALELEITRGNISDVIKGSVTNLFAYAKMRNISFSLDLQENLIFEFDKERIHDVIDNLVVNALKYAPSGSSIKIQSKIENGFAIISIKDKGIGVTQEEQQKIFQKFGKIEHYGKNLDVDIDGVGMGLYIAKRIVGLHNGKIWVESEGRNKGSIFSVSLPLHYTNNTLEFTFPFNNY